jgi:hypothetical protein
MIWFFRRGDETVKLETSLDNKTQEYVLVIRWAERPAETERFQTLEAFDTRVRQLDQQLMTEHYAQVGGPAILADGWKGSFSH